jgi:type VI secretion system protein
MSRRAAKQMARALLVLLIFASLLAIPGCSLKKKIKSDAEKVESDTKKVTSDAGSGAKKIIRVVTLTPSPLDLKVGIDNGANKDSPVAVDVVLIKDKNFWKTAPPMAAKDWFSQKSDLQRRYGKKLVVTSWEWVPGQPIPPITLKVPRFLNGAMVFARYPSPGSHSAPLPRGGKVSISLQKEDFTMVVK